MPRMPILRLASCLLFTAASAAAQTPKPMSIVDLLEVPRLADAQLSPDGKRVLYVRDAPDWKANRRVGHIWRINADGSNPVQLTYGERGETSPRWSPDGTKIAFLARRGADDKPQAHVLQVDGGEARQLTHVEPGVSNLQWAPDSASLYFLADDPKTADEKEREKLKDDAYAFEENDKQRHLWSVDVATGATKRITGGDYSVTDYDLSDDGRKIALHRAISPILEHSGTSEIWVMNADGSGAAQLTKNSIAESDARLSPDNSQVLFTASANAAFEGYYNSTAFVVPASGGAATLVKPGLRVDNAAWGTDGRRIYFVGNMGVHSQIFELDLSTKAHTALTKGDHTIQGWQFVSAAGRHVFHRDEPTRPGEVWVMAPGAAPVQVTRVYDALAAQFALPRQERITWKGADGVPVEGLLYYPHGYTPGTRYPLVVQTHGGPQASDKFGFGSWGSYVPVLTGKGYAVLKPNYRGSTGYGDAFLRDMVGGYFKQSHLDVMAGVDHVIALGVADPEKLVKMGWSAGGHMTNKIVTFTTRFKAASSGAGAANWVSMYAQSDTRMYRTPWFGGTPWQANAPIDVYWAHSPLKDVANVRTPTIFIVGEADERVPPQQSVEMYRALKSNGVPTHLYLAPREPHGWTEMRHQLFKINVELEWFERHVHGRTHAWERAPGDAPRPVPRTTP